MQYRDENVVQVEHLNKVFHSIRGFWKREKHSIQADSEQNLPCYNKSELGVYYGYTRCKYNY
jgi:hypothetical protein